MIENGLEAFSPAGFSTKFQFDPTWHSSYKRLISLTAECVSLPQSKLNVSNLMWDDNFKQLLTVNEFIQRV